MESGLTTVANPLKDHNFCNANANKCRALYAFRNILEAMTKTPITLAKQMERAMCRAGRNPLLYRNEHCALFENDLRYICPKNDQNRKKKLIEFAAQYGFRLRFYHAGLFAIFGKRRSGLADDAHGLWPAVTCAAACPI